MAGRTYHRNVRRFRKTKKNRAVNRRVTDKRTRRRGGMKTTTHSHIRSVRTSVRPYTAKSKMNTLEQQLVNLLSSCKDTEHQMKGKLNQKRPMCMHGASCMRINPDHFKKFAHPIDSAVLTQPFKLCTDKFMAITHNMFKTNDNSMPKEWYITVSEFLRESDYTRYDSLYFNIIANLCIHHDEYTALYPDKMFWNHFYTGLEEGAAVTGMFDVQHMPRLSKCLHNMKSVDNRYLSNTALLMSETYGGIHTDFSTDGDAESDSDDNK